MLDRTLFSWAPVVIAAGALSFAADWLLTVAGAKAYVAVRDRWSIEGSYEMNPEWVAAVESGRWVTGRVLIVVAMIGGLMAFAWLLDDFSRREIAEPLIAGPALFPAIAGLVLLVEAPTLMQHAGNLVQFRAMDDSTAVSGQLRISRWFMLDQVAWQYLRFAVLWLLLAAASQQLFFLGGAIGCALVWLRFRRHAMTSRHAGIGEAAG